MTEAEFQGMFETVHTIESEWYDAIKGHIILVETAMPYQQILKTKTQKK